MLERKRRLDRARREAGTAWWLFCALSLLAAGCDAGESAPPSAPPVGADPAGEAAPAADPAPKAAVPERWRKWRGARVDPALTEEQRRLVARLDAIGYAAGGSEASSLSGVVVHVRGQAYEGLNLYTSGHAPEAILMDMDGRVLHRWRKELLDVWDDHPVEWLTTGAHYWRRAHLFPNGDLLAIFEGIGIVKLDRNSRVLWANPIQAHHDLDVQPNGDIYVLTRAARIVPRLDPEHPVLEDFVTVLGPDGSEKRRVSLLESLERSDFRELWRYRPNPLGADLFHANTVSVLRDAAGGAHPVFRAGNVLTSLLQLDVIAVLDMEREEIVWARKGRFKKQHDPQLVAGGGLLLFDNRGARPFSRVLEFESGASDRVVWDYSGSPERPFWSNDCGAVERLPNGNTLITESNAGRAFEVTRAKDIVWEFYSPHRTGEHGELVSNLFDVVRLAPDFPVDWAEHGRPAAAAAGTAGN